MKKLRIGQISPINLPIPPKKYGGAEKIIYWLCEELTKKGHEVFLFATGDSKVSCHLCPVIEKSLWTFQHKDSAPYYAYEMAVIARKAKELKLDILHDHLGPWSLTLYGQINIPIIHTLHIPIESKDRIWAYKKLNSKLVSISNAQRKPAPDLNYVATIYNGINVKNFHFNNKPKNHFIWVGELSPRKGILEVIKVAKLTKIKLIIAGRIPPPTQGKDYQFFQKYVKKELNKGNITYVGEVQRRTIGRYYRNARAFLYPLQWEEPFGLVIVESMACGTPVIAYRRGSMPELIKSGETGFVVKSDLNKLIEAMEKINQIDRALVRKEVEERFSKERMVDDYEKVYYKLCRKK